MSTDTEKPRSRHFLRRRQVLQGSIAAALPASLLSCSTHSRAGALVVGGLPVTCNLTLPIACVARAAANATSPATGPRFDYEYSKYNGWPEIKESLMAGRIQAAYMLAPLVMDLADRGIPVKIVSLGHRSGAVIMVRADSPYLHFRRAGRQAHRHSQSLRGRLSVPEKNAGSGRHDTQGRADRGNGAARYAGSAVRPCGGCVLHRRALRRLGAACRLCARAAHDARRMAQLYLLCIDGTRGTDPARTLRWCRIWSTMCSGRACGWTRNRTIATRPWPSPAGRKFFNQDPNIIQFVMDNPTDRVTYGDLRMIRSEFEDLMQLSLDAGTIKHPIAYEAYVDERFARIASRRRFHFRSGNTRRDSCTHCCC
jgi:NitT/TauT family transport system substrate-binding protein